MPTRCAVSSTSARIAGGAWARATTTAPPAGQPRAADGVARESRPSRFTACGTPCSAAVQKHPADTKERARVATLGCLTVERQRALIIARHRLAILVSLGETDGVGPGRSGKRQSCRLGRDGGRAQPG